jgi:CRP-like cAMP-binding protein
LNSAQLKEIAMIAEESQVEKGTILFEECEQADKLYLLQDGSVELFYRSAEEFPPKPRKEFLVGEINPGEVFAISSLIEPYTLNATARATQSSSLVVVDAPALRQMFEKDPLLAYQMMNQTAKVLMERLGYIRVQLAAANA